MQFSIQAMSPLYLSGTLRKMEQQYQQQFPHIDLMQRAGKTAAEVILQQLGTVSRAGLPQVLVLIGHGNNGGDGLVTALALAKAGCAVSVGLVGQIAKFSPQTQLAYQQWLAHGGKVETSLAIILQWLQATHANATDVIVDALLGIGLRGMPNADMQQVITQLHHLQVLGWHGNVIALDVPSGVQADTGYVYANPNADWGWAVRADTTVTFIGDKPGLHTGDGDDYAGKVIGKTLDVDLPTADGYLIQAPPVLPPARKRNSHKGTHGTLVVVGGAAGMRGAVCLAARAGLLIGAGKVFACMPQAEHANDNLQAVNLPPEIMQAIDSAVFNQANCLVLGPGLGMSQPAVEWLRQAMALATPLVLDADALNRLATDASLRQLLQQRGNAGWHTIMTPHPGEARRLLAAVVPTDWAPNNQTQQANDYPYAVENRIAAAQTLAREYHSICVLKGAGSLIAMPDGRWFMNASGNPGLAAAGMGDTLAGLIGGLITQGLAAQHAALLAVYLHGAAADTLAKSVGEIGLTASEIALQSRYLLNQWVRG